MVALSTWDVRLLVPAQWRGAGKIIYVFRDSYDPEVALLAHFLGPGSCFIDVGAQLGIYTVIGGKLVGNGGMVLSFEPAHPAFGFLQRNIELNGLRNVRAFGAALADQPGTAKLYHHPDASRNSIGPPARGANDPLSFEEVPVQKLDDVLKDLRVDQVDLLKMDVEGAEELVLRGAEWIVGLCHPKILFEINPSAASALGLSADGAWRLLSSWGYTFYTPEAERMRRLTSPPPGVSNVFAIHQAD